ncbi:RdgB/HAM1 family non-canonical purine NTP pyrophosphatase [Synechococcus sp. PROS-7-1]|uniref:RdgB/HAM1 family non-canonical purine NTP pyrophosphatase n=1 Tax=Synechococcus sp. PROS-7-1 TaxID=1442556 RepID=UPI0016496EE1|nr:RdgB/HAM1 family non-canonical purine NTP pyrophosphatase [Synechococcus sp. PROS-7-1]
MSPSPRTLVIASGNRGKIREFEHLLSSLPLRITAQPEGLEVEETGQTFAANARLKALAVANATESWALADDSGLSVDALNGAPGVHSARYAPTDPERISRLLEALKDQDNRSAHFCAALCLAAPGDGVLLEVQGRCEGQITRSPRGEGGFGYDPIFEVDDTARTFAEMSTPEKKAQGHRGRAFALLEPQLRQLLFKA